MDGIRWETPQGLVFLQIQILVDKGPAILIHL